MLPRAGHHSSTDIALLRPHTISRVTVQAHPVLIFLSTFVAKLSRQELSVVIAQCLGAPTHSESVTSATAHVQRTNINQ